MAYSKGQIITMNLDGIDREYRILKLDGNIAEVVCMSTVGKSKLGDDGTYAGGSLDTYLNSTWYNTLTAAAKAAIVSKTFNQDSWYSDATGSPVYSGNYGTTVPGKYPYSISKGSATYGDQITRNVYALSVQDVIDYITDTDVGDGKLENYNIWKMFWNTTTQPSISEYLLLRSAYASNTNNAWLVKSDGSVSIYNIVHENAVRPALTIDLSKITISRITLDLSTIGLSEGTHSIQMKLSDDGVTKADSALSNAVSYTQYQQLTAPVISLSGNILTWSAVPNASSYKLYADNTDKGTVTSGIDLTTLQLDVGTHSIQVMAVGSGYYTDSDKSNSVSYTVQPAPGGYTVSITYTNTQRVDGSVTINGGSQTLLNQYGTHTVQYSDVQTLELHSMLAINVLSATGSLVGYEQWTTVNITQDSSIAVEFID